MMKRSLLILTILFLNNFVSVAQDTLTILHLNDTHSTLSSTGPRDANLNGTQGGIARAANLIGLTKMTEPNVLTLHAGDVFIGDLFFNVFYGAAEFQLLNAIGIDAMAVGNHEFDLEPSTLLQSLQGSFLPDEGFPFLSANTILDDPEVQPLQDYIKQFTIKQIGNIKVGILGLTTPETNLLSLPSPAIISDDIVEIAAAMIDSLTANNCDVIILLSHLGLYLDQVVAGNVPGIDIIVGGHDHYLLETPLEILNPLNETTLIVQAGSHYIYMGKLKLAINNGNVELINYEIIHLDESIPEEPSVLNEVNSLITQIEAVYGPVYTQQICHANDFFEEVAHSLMSKGDHDTPIGNIVTDAFRQKTGTDIAIEAGGSTAQPFYQGPLVAADAFRVVGYGFNLVNGLGYRLVTFDMPGAVLLGTLETVLSTIELNDEFFPQISGMKYTYNPNNPAGERLLSVIINGNDLNPHENYSITSNEFLAAFLDYSQVPISNFFLYDSLSEFEVLAEYIALQQNISPVIEGRIVADIETGIDDNINQVPENFELLQNYPNPFNPSTTFEFQIPNSETVSLKIYDILGNEVTVIVNEHLPIGTYKYQWDASERATGVYFYRLQTKNYVETKKLILIK